MTTNELVEQNYDRITEIIQQQVGHLTSLPSFATADPEDLAQDLWLKFLPLVKHYDLSRGEFGAFASCVIGNLAIDMTRSAISDQEDRPETVSLFDPVNGDGKTVERIETISVAGDEARLRELRHDLRVVIGMLPPHLRKLCALLSRRPSMGIKALARATSKKRSLVCAHLQELQAHFRRYGMDKYLKA
jgi:DNA-directed RNA polymerase specialized sigma24 family protein